MAPKVIGELIFSVLKVFPCMFLVSLIVLVTAVNTCYSDGKRNNSAHQACHYVPNLY